jgi:hypothetical protein
VTVGVVGRATRFAIESPRGWPIGLAGFLARGGIVPFVLPIVVLPSVVGLTTFVGPTSISAAGLAPRFVQLIATVFAVVSVWLIVGTLVGAWCERTLIQAVLSTPDPNGGPSVGGGGGTGPARATGASLGRLLVVRLVALIPFGVALAIAGLRLGQVAYQELILPSDAVRQVVVRVLVDAPEAVTLLIAGWLVSETIGAGAVRRVVLEGASLGGALASSVAWPVRHPLRWVVAFVLPTAASIVLIGAAIASATALWSAVGSSLLGPVDPVSQVLLAVAFVAVWVGGLTLAGIAAVGRSAAWSLAVTEDHRGGGLVAVTDGTL